MSVSRHSPLLWPSRPLPRLSEAGELQALVSFPHSPSKEPNPPIVAGPMSPHTLQIILPTPQFWKSLATEQFLANFPPDCRTSGFPLPPPPRMPRLTPVAGPHPSPFFLRQLALSPDPPLGVHHPPSCECAYVCNRMAGGGGAEKGARSERRKEAGLRWCH